MDSHSPSPLIASYDIFQQTLKSLDILSSLQLFATSRTLQSQRNAELTRALAEFIYPFLPPKRTVTILRSTHAFIINLSSYVFIFETREKWSTFRTLFLAVPQESYPALEHFLQSNNYTEFKDPYAGTPFATYNNDDHPVNHRISAIVRFKRDQHKIIVTISASTSILSIALNAGTTAFMNIVGPDSMWSAYPKATRQGYSIRNPAPDLMPQLLPGIRNCSFRQFPSTSRATNAVLHAITCEASFGSAHMREGSDKWTLFVYFAPDACLLSDNEYQRKRSFEDSPVVWVLGGTCCDRRRSRIPLLVELCMLHVDYIRDKYPI